MKTQELEPGLRCLYSEVDEMLVQKKGREQRREILASGKMKAKLVYKFHRKTSLIVIPCLLDKNIILLYYPLFPDLALITFWSDC